MEFAFDKHKDNSDPTNTKLRATVARERMGMRRGTSNEAAKPNPQKTSDSNAPEREEQGDRIVEIPINKLVPNPYQPRLDYNPDSLLELAASIKEHGLLQPIVVTEIDNGMFMIHFGHRRWKSCNILKMSTVKSIVRATKTPDQNLLAEALIENLQREEMSIIDTALSIRAALDSGLFSDHEAVGAKIGKDATQVSKILKILTLPESVLRDITINKTIKDRVVLDHLRKIENEQVCIEIYEWYKSARPSRDEAIARIKSSAEPAQKITDTFVIKNTDKGCTIKLDKLTPEQEEKVRAFMESLLGR